MPLFECLRCNTLSYSSASTPAACDVCGETRRRLLGSDPSFAAAAERPRRLGPGDHCALVFHDDTLAAQACSALFRAAVTDCSLMIGHLPDAVIEHIPTDVCARVEWVGEDHAYPADFSPEATIARYRAIIEAEPGTTMVMSGPTRPVAEICAPDDWRRYERLAHEAAVELEAIVVCVYDARVHDEETLDLCRVCHPMLAGRAVRRNPAFTWAPAA